MAYENKIAIIIKDNLQTWQKLNVASFYSLLATKLYRYNYEHGTRNDTLFAVNERIASFGVGRGLGCY